MGRNRLFDYPSILARADGNPIGTVSISAVTAMLAIDAISVAMDRWRWLPMNDSDWNDCEAAVSAALMEIMTEVSTMDLPVGMIFPYFRDTVPDGCLRCDGAIVDRVDYPLLYDFTAAVFPLQIIDADTFYTPNLNNSWILGADTGNEFDYGTTQIPTGGTTILYIRMPHAIVAG